MTTKKLTKLLALYLPYLLLGLVATNFGEAWRLAEGKELGDKIMSMMGTIPVAFANPLPSLYPLDLLVGLCCGAGLRLAVYLRGKNAKKYRHGMEYGSARWGTPKDIEPFMAPKFADNIILTKTERLMMSNRPPDPKNARNKNVLVVGGSGSGKTRFWLKPNLLQCHSSYVVTDPKGSIVVECGNALLKNGYKVRILNTINFKKSMHYNPFAYVHSEKDILKLVTTLMTNTKGEGSGGDPFWEKSERLLLTALIAYLHYEAPVEEQNFATLLEMLNTMQVLEDDEEYQNPVDLLFEELGKKKPNSFAVRQYKLYKLAAGKTAKSILISCGARLAPFDIQELRNLTMYDELALDTLGDKKTALFLIMSDTDSTFNFLISMVYTQLFNLLCDKADDVYGGKLPIHVRCLIDECANIGQIPNLEKLVATMSKQCDIVRDILPLYVDDACSEASAEMVKEHLNACADCNAIYQKLLSHTSEDVLHEESESVIMRHEAKEKQRGRKKITIAVLVSIALCIIAIFTALFLLPINIAYEPVKIDFPFEVEDVENVEMYHYDGVPASAEKKVVVAENDIKTLYDKFKGLSLKDKTTEETAGADVTSFRFNLSDGTSYDLIYACYGVKNGELKSAAGGFKYFTSADIGSYWNNLNTELEAIPINESELP